MCELQPYNKESEWSCLLCTTGLFVFLCFNFPIDHIQSVVLHLNLVPLALQDRRVNVIKLEMQNRLWVKEEKLKQLKAIVTEDRIPDRPDRPPCQMQPKQHLPAPRLPSPTPAPLPSPSPSTSSSSSPLPVCRVNNTHLEHLPNSWQCVCDYLLFN